MPVYTRNEIVDILMILGECRGNYRAAARLYRERFPGRDHHPNDRAIAFIERRERQQPVVRRRRRIMVIERDDPRFLAVLAMVAINPHISLREIEDELGIPRSTAQRILQLHRFHPYHITLTQELTARDFQRRLEFCNWAQAMLRRDPDFFRYVMFSDEATFHNTGQLNRHNCHYWSAENPHWSSMIDHQNRWSLIVWCGIVNGFLIGPYFFDGNVNSARYLHLLTNELPILLEEVDLQTRQRMWLQQDGAGAHRSNIVRDFLNREFPQRWIGIGSQVVEWCPRSPDLTSPDFFLWGYIKNMAYLDPPTTRENMMQRITNICRNIPRNILWATVTSFERRVQLCIDNNGGIFENLIR